MARLVTETCDFLRSLERGVKILLINPPVQEKRYHWLRWNQPLELLRLGTWLKANAAAADVRLFDFMFPDDKGEVPRHKIKATWTDPQGESLWHFGQPFERFDEFLDALLKPGWVPDFIVVSSLTSYWHTSIEKLLVRICNILGPRHRPRVTIALYGAYPRVEPEHAEAQPEADVAFTQTVDPTGIMPDFELFLTRWARLPNFFALDIDDPDVPDHLAACITLHDAWWKRQGVRPPRWIDVAFFNEDLCGPKSQLKRLADAAEGHEGRVRIEAICGVQLGSMLSAEIELLVAIGTRAFFVEYATRGDGRLDEEAYVPFREFWAREVDRRRAGEQNEVPSRDAVTAFVNVGLPTDDLETVVRNTLVLNRFFQAIILKPFGYSPDLDPASASERRRRWALPAWSSPQWFPYLGHGSRLTLADYDNLMRWQGIINKRVKNHTFDFLGEGTVPRLVRETLIEESWRRRGAEA